MRYICTNCNYNYDEAFGDQWEWIEVWTKIENIEKCPVCDECDTFHHINEEICYIEDDTNDILEQEHFIEVSMEKDNLHVIIWDNIHPMWENHRIAWIWIFDEYWDFYEEKFLEIDTDPSVLFENFELEEFEVRIKCSVHQIFAKKFEL